MNMNVGGGRFRKPGPSQLCSLLVIIASGWENEQRRTWGGRKSETIVGRYVCEGVAEREVKASF